MAKVGGVIRLFETGSGKWVEIRENDIPFFQSSRHNNVGWLENTIQLFWG